MKNTIAAAVVATIGFAGAAQAETITFDEFAHGTPITQLTLAGGLTADVTANGNSSTSPDQAWVFDTTLENTLDDDLEDPFNDGTNFDITTGGVLIVQEDANTAADDDGRGGFIEFVFSQSITLKSFNFIDDGTVTVTAGTNSVTVGPGRSTSTNDFENFFSASGLLDWENVTTLRFDFGRNSGAIDNISYELSAVPLPASFLLLLAGLGGLGVASRKRASA